MISVIVPVYKVEKYLEKCVASIQCQTYADLEIILVDDGSPDRCGEICEELACKDRRIKVVHQKNGGLSAARNAGLEIFTGDFVAFVDSDDSIEPEMMETLLSSLAGCDWAICGYRSVSENEARRTVNMGRKDIQSFTPLDKDALWNEVFGRLNDAAWNKLYRAALIRDLRFPPGIVHGEDLIFNLQYLTKCRRGAICATPLYNYLQRAGSITRSAFSPRRFDEVTVKEIARTIVLEQCPALRAKADVYCFRARLNVLRSLWLFCQGTQLRDETQVLARELQTMYPGIKKSLGAKNRLEYAAYMHAKPLYNAMIKTVARR